MYGEYAAEQKKIKTKIKLPVVRYLKRKETEEILWKRSKIWRDASLCKTRQNDEDNT